MTPNEKKALVKFKELKQANTVAMAGTLRSTINYAGEVCKKLCEKGYLERFLRGQFAVYKITPSGEEQVKEEGASEKEIGVGVGAEEEKTVEPCKENPQDDSESGEGEKIEEYECTGCGAGVGEDGTECPKCGMVFEETVEEE
jgi:hypothetical protein